MNIVVGILFSIALAVSQNSDANNLQQLHNENAELRKENIDQQIEIKDMQERLEQLEIKFKYEVKK